MPPLLLLASLLSCLSCGEMSADTAAHFSHSAAMHLTRSPISKRAPERIGAASQQLKASQVNLQLLDDEKGELHLRAEKLTMLGKKHFLLEGDIQLRGADFTITAQRADIRYQDEYFSLTLNGTPLHFAYDQGERMEAEKIIYDSRSRRANFPQGVRIFSDTKGNIEVGQAVLEVDSRQLITAPAASHDRE